MDRLEAIEKLARLRESGVLTDDEYFEQKRLLMSSSSASVIPAPAPRTSLHGSHIEPPRSGTYAEPPPPQHIHIHNVNTQSMTAPTAYYSPHARSVVVAYLLWFFLWFVSAHRFYLRRPGSALLQICSYFILVGFVWLLIDALLIPGMVDGENRQLIVV